MTVSYSKEVATSSFSCFLKLLLRWRGSIYKLLWKDFAVFAVLFFTLSYAYRYILNEPAKRVFEKISIYCQEFNNLIPLAFVLGFYVSVVVNRFWEMFKTIPYPTRMAMFVSALITGIDDRGRMMRRTIMRYLCLSHVMTMAAICPPVKKRFPTLQHMTDAGFLEPNEQKILENMETNSNKYFVPLIWSASLVLRARKEGRIKDDFSVKTLIDEINEYRGKCGSLFAFDNVTVPLVYTQVVTIAVYMFFISCLMGRQFLEIGRYGDLYFPFFTFLQFLFYMGWLKVAESLVNPFGEDDDDFDVNNMIDSNLPMAYMIVDGMHQEHPELIKDQYWDSFNINLPYTEAAQKFQKDEFVGSAANIEIPSNKSQFLPPSTSTTTLHASNASSRQSSVVDMTKSPRDKPSKKMKRTGSKLSGIFKLPMSRQASRLDPPLEDEESNIDVPLKTFNKNDDAVKASPQDELMFQLSDDESPNSPKTNMDEKTLFSKPRPIQISSSIKHPAQPSPGASSVGSASSETASHFKYPTSLGHLDPVAEIAESPEAFIGSVISQLRDMRKGTNGNE